MKHSQYFFLLFFIFLSPATCSDGRAARRQHDSPPQHTARECPTHGSLPRFIFHPAPAGWLFHDHFAGLAVDDYSINSALEPQAVPRQEGAVEDNTPVDRINHNG